MSASDSGWKAVEAGQRHCAAEDCPLAASRLVWWGSDGEHVLVPLCWWHGAEAVRYEEEPEVDTLRCVTCGGPLQHGMHPVEDEVSGRIDKHMPIYECLVCDDGWERRLYGELLRELQEARYQQEVKEALRRTP